jgi:TonB family protein
MTILAAGDRADKIAPVNIAAMLVIAAGTWSWGTPLVPQRASPAPPIADILTGNWDVPVEKLPSIFEPGPASSGPQHPPTTAAERDSVDREIIRGAIRPHIDEVKACYEPELAKQPGLSGRIMVQFSISSAGDVIASKLQDSTMNNPTVESCTVQAVRRWRFPKPAGGGIVIVSYPFVLTPGTEADRRDEQGVGAGGAPAVDRRPR